MLSDRRQIGHIIDERKKENKGVENWPLDNLMESIVKSNERYELSIVVQWKPLLNRMRDANYPLLFMKL
eukprot:Seg984.4 transcript_id=Seg984.4/GoldUCD/mRNA.D3Y31 product="hypothetical protein" protein_id=Seg984.4/GoldUCD/D3Y31